ncbi:ChaN family lipoprotein [Pelagibius litoralis]|uniref:ChaN family lipoprotein n=1 Tax=Pelagibius litoralis TaxID=374515 RepID=A0A967EY68_9PROT|nr:ChaN family lipoprotein [Pelagibius litoralis]NIA69530.1 ChaN family lipoprotein [Pelagibius litoralis]
MLRRTVSVGFGALVFAFVSALAVGPARSETAGLLLRDHPLVGSIWETASGRQLDEAALFAAARDANWVLLGEQHTNADHHRLQARVVAAVAAAGRRPAVVWEMAGPAQAEALAAAKLDDVETLGKALDWEKRGWPSWSIYQPIAEAALTHGLKMHPGNPSPETTRDVSRGAPLSKELKERLDWSLEYDGDQLTALTALLATSHCNALPESALKPMADVQRLRDAWMAASLRQADGGSGAILIAGSEHVREDRGVPWRLGEPVFSLALVEVAQGQDVAKDYPAFDARLFDFVWFTAKVEEEDHCAKFFGKSNG